MSGLLHYRFNFWLILTTPHDPTVHRSLKKGLKATKSLFLEAFATRLFTGAVFFAVPIIASAGFLSLISNFFSGAVEEVASVVNNSQNMALLQAAASSDPNPAKGGGDITVVSGSALLADTGPNGSIADVFEEANQHGTISVYVVRQGDTLSQIAKMFGVSVNTIVWNNDIKKGLIHEGQTLIILPISGVQHTVAKGETMQSIAKKYKGDVEEIIRYNNLAEGQALAVGDVVIIPDGEVAMPSASAPTARLYGASGPDYGGFYIRPIIGGRKTQGLHGYNAVDLANYYGAPVFASAAGQVIIARSGGWNGGYGSYVVVTHSNGTQTLYAHLSQVSVSAGQQVLQGQVIGVIGSTGKSTGPHLHFEVRGAKNPF